VKLLIWFMWMCTRPLARRLRIFEDIDIDELNRVIDDAAAKMQLGLT
jgi:hypothetical protein